MLRSNLRARPRLLGYDIIGCTVIWALLVFVLALALPVNLIQSFT